MQINHRTLAPLHCASTDETRHNLNSLHFDKGGETIGTNGHILARVIPDDSIEIEPFTLEASTLKDLNKEQRKRNTDPATLTVESGHVCINQGPAGTLELPKSDAEYPNWRQVLPEDKECLHVGLSLHVLESLIATARQFTQTKKGEGVRVHFEFPKDGKWGAIKATVGDKESGDALEFAVMPNKLPGS